MQDIYIKNILLQNYRNLNNYNISSDNQSILLVGDNGVGKTNILEAISLIAGGRGIRNSKFEDIIQHNQQEWLLECKLQSKLGLAEIITYFNYNTNKRHIEFNGSKITNQELTKFSNIVWLTPQMEGIFLSSNSDRRKFLDRIVYNFYDDHAAVLNKYEYYLSQRTQVLQNNILNIPLLDILEKKIAENALIVAHNRVNTINNLQNIIDNLDTKFPKVLINIDNNIENQIMNNERDVEQFIIDRLNINRNSDKHSGKTNIGVHKSDLKIYHYDKNILAKFCSTGEQKAMLVTLIVAQIIGIRNITNYNPIILLDEVFSHLDNQRCKHLIDFLINLKSQIWITMNNLNNMEDLIPYSKIINLP